MKKSKQTHLGYVSAANVLTSASLFVQFFAIITLLVGQLEGSRSTSTLVALPWLAIVVLLPVLVEKTLANVRRSAKIPAVPFGSELILSAVVALYLLASWYFSSGSLSGWPIIAFYGILLAVFVGWHWFLRYLFLKRR